MLPILILRRREENRELIRLRRGIRSNIDPFALPDNRFIELFRLNKNAVANVIELINDHLHHPLRRHGIEPEIAVLCALRFYATGSYQRSLGQDFNFGLSQTSVHRCIRTVTHILDVHLVPNLIKFPNRREQRQEIKVNFMENCRFPGVIGAIDCTHVAILKPSMEEHNFINRKGYHSLNVQAVCDHSMKIININANFGCSTHDAFIWRNSQLQNYPEQLHEQGERNSWLIGDSGYPLQPYLLTPVPNTVPNSPEEAYNTAHTSARNVIERCYGLLKMRFRCLLKERVARYSPEFVASLVAVCSALHNICITDNIPIMGENNYPVEEENEAVNPQREVLVHNLFEEGQLARNNIINMYFNN